MLRLSALGLCLLLAQLAWADAKPSAPKLTNTYAKPVLPEQPKPPTFPAASGTTATAKKPFFEQTSHVPLSTLGSSLLETKPAWSPKETSWETRDSRDLKGSRTDAFGTAMLEPPDPALSPAWTTAPEPQSLETRRDRSYHRSEPRDRRTVETRRPGRDLTAAVLDLITRRPVRVVLPPAAAHPQRPRNVPPSTLRKLGLQLELTQMQDALKLP